MCPSESSSETSASTITVDPAVLAHVVDVHCHPTDSPPNHELMDSLHIRVCAMATRDFDQALVRELATTYPEKVVPCFGYHPWFTHWIALSPPVSKESHYRDLLLGSSPKPEHEHAFAQLLPDLPDPLLLADIIAGMRENLTALPNAMVGEVGIDRAARIPFGRPSPTPYALEYGERREMSPLTVPLEHQLAILEAQFDLAVELGRNVSFHSVKSQQATVGLLKRLKARHGDAWDAISVDMHSCGLSTETWRDLERTHCNIFLSLSTAINSRSPAHRKLISVCSPHRILAESDYHDISYSTGQTWNMIRTIAEVKGWDVEQTWEDEPGPEEGWGVVRRLENNWSTFQPGNHKPSKR